MSIVCYAYMRVCVLPSASCGDLIGHLEKVSFHCNHKEGKHQRMFKLLYKCTCFTF